VTGNRKAVFEAERGGVGLPLRRVEVGKQTGIPGRGAAETGPLSKITTIFLGRRARPRRGSLGEMENVTL